MVVFHLARVAFANLWVRARRTTFLVLSVAIGAGTLVALLVLQGSLDALIRRNLQQYQQLAAERTDLAEQRNTLIATLPVSQMIVRAPAGDVTKRDLNRLRRYELVERVEPVAFLFPVVLGITPRALEVPGVREADLRKEIKLPTTLYGVPEGYIPDSDLIAGEEFGGVEPGSRQPVPAVLPRSLLEFLSTLRSEDMVDRFAEVAYARLERAMERRPQIRENLARSLTQLPGVGALTDAVIKKVIRDAVRNFLEQVDPARLPESFGLTLYPGLEEESLEVPLHVVGYSDRLPNTGVAVPIEHLEEWNRMFHEETTGALTRLLSSDPEATYAEVHVHTAGYQASKELRLQLLEAGYEVESAVEEALAVEKQLASLEGEAERIQGEANRVGDLSETLARGTWVFSVLLFLMAGTVIANGLTLSVLEQQKRIGIFRAVGATRLAVLGIFLLEAAVVGALGAGLGLAAAELALPWAGPQLVAGLAAGDGVDPSLFQPSTWIRVGAIGVGVGISIVAGFVPASRAASLQPVEVLKH